jgi:hypothetical protein
MVQHANIYDICDAPILKEQPRSEPGKKLRFLYRKSACNWLLKYLILNSCRHPQIPPGEIPIYQAVIRAAMQADYANWRNAEWIRRTFRPIAELLDLVAEPRYRHRQHTQLNEEIPKQEQCDAVIECCMRDILRVWTRDKSAPYFPVAAQVILSGDEHMDGKAFLEVLCGVGAFEYQNTVLLSALLRCFITANPAKLKLMRKSYRGIAETMFMRPCWILHRTAFYDANFFEHLLALASKSEVNPEELRQVVQIMENLLCFCVVDSREWIVTPNRGIRHPAMTCLPIGPEAVYACRLSRKGRSIKTDLGFGDYAPDTDTTFFTLSIAKKWLDFIADKNLDADAELLSECRKLLDHPWVEIIYEYQIGSGYTSNPPTIRLTKPLDYQGAIPIWFDKPFLKADGRIVRNVAGNEICPGHNMDILESC